MPRYGPRPEPARASLFAIPRHTLFGVLRRGQVEDRALRALAIEPSLLDEKIKGTVHVALGRSYPETGGKNMSALHWDLICDLRPGGRLSADGETIMENGTFKWPLEPGP